MPTLLTKLRWSAHLARQLARQASFPFASAERIAQEQARRVRAMVRHGYRTVPHYRETIDRLGLQPDAFRSAVDLSRLPILERDALQR